MSRAPTGPADALESAFGQWPIDSHGIARFRPHRLDHYLAQLAGVTPDLRMLADTPATVAAQAQFVLGRYLCGGVALRSGGGLSWPQVLEAHGAGSKATARQPRNQRLPAAGQQLFDQHRRFIDAVELLQQYPLQRLHWLQAHAGLCPEISHHCRGRLRSGDVWVRGSSVADAKFVPIDASEIPSAVDRLMADCNECLARPAAPGPAADDISMPPSAPAALRARADLGFAAYLALLGWHPFADGNGRLARALYQALAGGGGESPAGALFAAAHLLVLRALQPQQWGQNFWRAQRGLSDPATFLAQCRETAGIALSLCRMLLEGLHAAEPSAENESPRRWWRPCPLVSVEPAGTARADRSLACLQVTLPAGRTGIVARSTIAFLMAFELALHDCVETTPVSD